MQNVKDKVVVITGASSGIGAVTAELLAADGAKVVLSARRKDRLEELEQKIHAAGGEALAVESDVTSPDQMNALASATVEKFGRLDVWVNNAGVMPLSPVAMGRTDEWNRMVDVNIKGVLNGVAAAHPIMLEQGDGHFVNVSSVAGHLVFPGAAVYCATKFAVRAFGEGIRMESGGAVRVTNISPGAVRTELADHIAVAEVKEGVQPFLDIAIEPDAIARAIRFAIAEPGDVDVNEVIVRPTKQEL
ncbi:MAG: SDR family oxidoreductase [Planctomycetota bacterium]|nr:SDR family oxidoreductase [Planctomycetota bacterium]